MRIKTYTPKSADIQRDWYVVDAKDQTLGRLATQIAVLLRGKHKPIFTPHLDVGDFVIVVNADKIRVTGDKMETKMYHRHSGYPSGLTTTSLRDMLERHPDRVIRSAVRGMLPKNSLGRQQLTKLKIYAQPTHPHEAQRPKTYEL